MSGGFVVFPLPASLALPIAIAENRQGAETIIPILSLLISFALCGLVLIARNTNAK